MHDSGVELEAFTGEEGVATAGHMALVAVVHVSVEVDVVVCLRRKLLIAVCSIRVWGGEGGGENGRLELHSNTS